MSVYLKPELQIRIYSRLNNGRKHFNTIKVTEEMSVILRMHDHNFLFRTLLPEPSFGLTLNVQMGMHGANNLNNHFAICASLTYRAHVFRDSWSWVKVP